MKIVTDCGMDLAPEQLEGLDVRPLPLNINLRGQSYRSGIDIDACEFYRLLSETEDYPTTSQPAAGDFAELYREIAREDPDILSIHISSGLSGTMNAAKAGAAMVPEARVTFWDTKLLSCPEGWQVLAAARAVKAGWSLDRVLDLLEKVRNATDGLYTLGTLKYLIHGGRISHLKGLMASLLNIKPIIGVDKTEGVYQTHAQEITLKRAILKIPDVIARQHPKGSTLRVQLMHGDYMEGVDLLREKLDQTFKCIWELVVQITPVLGAHTGSVLVGCSIGLNEAYSDIP
ncbi:MAG TPA: DegV family protein [Anaerolineaceae bacterium]|nr:DegV family protein [Anaerolineaceae bacterium]HPN52724.1 DegV family protein [Anaerolineaceae bacterium]